MAYLLRYLASIVAFYSGLLALFVFMRARLFGPSTRILAYHGFRDGIPHIQMFMPPELFAGQVRFLSRNYDVVSLGEYVRSRGGCERRRRDAVIVTMDDGYADNFEVAMPLCRRHAVSMTVFVTTNCIGTGSPTFVAALIVAVDASLKRRISLPQYGLPDLSLGSLTDQERAIRKIDGMAKTLGAGARAKLLDDVLAELQVSSTELKLDELMLSWEQLRQMQEAGMEVGSHTRSHPVLASIGDADLDSEVGGSLEDIEAGLGRRPNFLAYPYGGRSDFDERAEAACDRHGLKAAVTLSRDNPDLCPPFRIGRDMITIDRCANPWGSFSKALFACEVSGMTDSVLRRIGLRK